MDNIEILKAFVEAADKAVKNFRQENNIGKPEPDAFWDRLIELLGMHPRSTKSDVIEMVKTLKLEQGYATLGSDQVRERYEQLLAEKNQLDEEHRALQHAFRSFKDEVSTVVKDLSRHYEYFTIDIDDVLGRH